VPAGDLPQRPPGHAAIELRRSQDAGLVRKVLLRQAQGGSSSREVPRLLKFRVLPTSPAAIAALPVDSVGRLVDSPGAWRMENGSAASRLHRPHGVQLPKRSMGVAREIGAVVEPNSSVADALERNGLKGADDVRAAERVRDL